MKLEDLITKSYTDLEQSKRLAKILSDETADFFWLIGRLHTDGPRYEVIRTRNEVSEPETCWPCWSLAALLDYLSANFRVDIKYLNNYWELDCRVQVTYGKELVDACYEMIIKLHEQKLL